MQDASPDELESHIRRYYTDQAALQFIIDGDDVYSEIRFWLRILTRDVPPPHHEAP